MVLLALVGLVVVVLVGHLAALELVFQEPQTLEEVVVAEAVILAVLTRDLAALVAPVSSSSNTPYLALQM